MKKLDLEIRKGGFNYIQQKRNKNTAMYYQYDRNGVLAGIEIFRIKTIGDKQVFNSFVPAHECFPSDSDFGTGLALSVGINKERAEKKYRELNAKVLADLKKKENELS